MPGLAPAASRLTRTAGSSRPKTGPMSAWVSPFGRGLDADGLSLFDDNVLDVHGVWEAPISPGILDYILDYKGP